jgi:hypothetical protein
MEDSLIGWVKITMRLKENKMDWCLQSVSKIEWIVDWAMMCGADKEDFSDLGEFDVGWLYEDAKRRFVNFWTDK